MLTSFPRPHRLATLVATLAVALVAALSTAAPAPADHNHGGNFCLNQGHNIYASPSMSSAKVGWVSYYDVWHHYGHSGNWSLGYIKGSNPVVRGYIPLGVIQYETTHDAVRCH